ncbi:MAG: hypothetical protein H6672_20530 [Anaerolineaceae bacterium]|nr:hypothetical protein [Anaerolineaceae bacterium]
MPTPYPAKSQPPDGMVCHPGFIREGCFSVNSDGYTIRAQQQGGVQAGNRPQEEERANGVLGININESRVDGGDNPNEKADPEEPVKRWQTVDHHEHIPVMDNGVDFSETANPYSDAYAMLTQRLRYGDPPFSHMNPVI